jgi:hypothetical protein
MRGADGAAKAINTPASLSALLSGVHPIPKTFCVLFPRNWDNKNEQGTTDARQIVPVHSIWVPFGAI